MLNILVKCPKTFFLKLVSIDINLFAVLAHFAIFASFCNRILLFLKNYFGLLSASKLVDYRVCWCIVIFPVWCQRHILKGSRPTICKFFCFSSNSYASYYLPVFLIWTTFCSGRRVFIVHMALWEAIVLF